MSVIDRVMRAYSSKHTLTPHQAAFVRDELSKFIDELMAKPRRAPTMFAETSGGANPGAPLQRTSDKVRDRDL